MSYDAEFISLSSCESTNTYLKVRYQELKDRLPVVVTAEQQTGGRGRDQRTWISKPGLGIYSSIGFEMAANQPLQFLSVIAGIAVIETLKPLAGVEFSLKWPNDVQYNGKKIAGILIENALYDDRIFCVVGIGVNINHQVGDFPPELKDIAVSLRMITGKSQWIEIVNNILVSTFFSWLELLKENKGNIIIQTANRYSSNWLDREISLHHNGKRINGIFKGINHDGGLILEQINDITYADGETPANNMKHSFIQYSGEIVNWESQE